MARRKPKVPEPTTRYECVADIHGPRMTTERLANSEREAAEQAARAFHTAYWVGYNPAGGAWAVMQGQRCVGSVRVHQIWPKPEVKQS